MAVQIQVAGLATIKIASPSGGSLETLGYSLNGVEITEEIYTCRVDGDFHGGEEGPPLDVQELGQMDIVQMTLTSWDAAVLAKLQASLAGGTAGVAATHGQLYIQGAKTWRLLITAPSFTRNYPLTIFQRPKTINVGTKHSRAILVGECHEAKSAGGTLWNTTTT